MNNTIANPKTEVAKGIDLNDKDYMTSILTCLKELTKNYAVALTEASNEELYQKYFEIFTSISRLQREVYEVMFKKGWYTLEQAEELKIKNAYDTLNQEYQSLNV